MTKACKYADCMKSYDNYREFNILMRLGPTLLGEKPMHVFCFNNGFKYMTEVLNDFKFFFENHSTLKYIIVASDNSSIKVIVYNISTMEKLLNDKRTIQFLSNYGFKHSKDPSFYMNILAQELKKNKIPAEFGIFFGYPIKDVMGFIGHPSLKHVKTNAWKVYGDPKISDIIFSRFKAAEDIILELCQSISVKTIVAMYD